MSVESFGSVADTNLTSWKPTMVYTTPHMAVRRAPCPMPRVSGVSAKNQTHSPSARGGGCMYACMSYATHVPPQLHTAPSRNISTHLPPFRPFQTVKSMQL